jgi:hypothetical protein
MKTPALCVILQRIEASPSKPAEGRTPDVANATIGVSAVDRRLASR